jgi:hypothetical protein
MFADLEAAAERFGLLLTHRGDRWEIVTPEGAVLELYVS